MSIKSIYQAYKAIKSNPGILEITKKIFDFACNVSEINRPMITKIALVNMGTAERVEDLVSLWAAKGNANPIERLTGVINQRNSLKDLCRAIKENGYVVTESDKKHIEMALTYFE